MNIFVIFSTPLHVLFFHKYILISHNIGKEKYFLFHYIFHVFIYQNMLKHCENHSQIVHD
jgi:hypothetical protein